QLRDDDLMLTLPGNLQTSEKWLLRNDAGRVAKLWLQSLGDLPQSARRSPLVVRLAELLQRQSGRVSTRHLSDDLREVSSREGDTAYDSLQLIRIIVWAIPMLGFLGTVIGITQTLGGLDFSDGIAAVDRLKSGLYVAFDTTALGLVLSVVAIFLQFPVERSEQRLLGEIDRRVGSMLSAGLPSDDHGDNPAAHIAELCDGIRVAVGQSLTSQAELWRTTIDEAHSHWERVAEDNSQRIATALASSLRPLLEMHTDKLSATLGGHTSSMKQQLDAHGESLRNGFGNHASVLKSQFDQHSEAFQATVKSQIAGQSETLERHSDSLARHSESFSEIRSQWNQDLASRLQKWNEAYSAGADAIAAHHKSLDRQAAALIDQNVRLTEAQNQLALASNRLAEQTVGLVETNRRTEQIALLQRSLDGNLLRLSEVNAAIQHGIQVQDDARQSTAVSDQLSGAMLVLARAVDVLTKQLPTTSRNVVKGELGGHADVDQSDTTSKPLTRRAA
ncbi:MAG TPA: hypothetical protein DDZ51_25785, partial [Planctomycetaceae bacterium]|nr:hypothetical protein [Planctomycetaceae bacterium]